MSSLRSGSGLVALSSGLLLGAALGCSHEQKAPPARPSPPVAARVAPRQSPPEPPAEAPQAPTAENQEPAIYFDFDS